MIKVHVAADGTKSFQVYERARVREKSIKVYVGSFASRREAEFAAQQHRVTQRGMRLDEALHLMWVDIDLTHRVIHVHRGRRGAPKSGRLRHVPIFDSVLTVLREMKLAKGENTLLWPGAKLDKYGEQLPRNKTSVFRPFKAAVLRAGVDKKLRLHDLRHTFAGLFLASGGDIFKLSKILTTPASRSPKRSTRHFTRMPSPRTTAAYRSRCQVSRVR